MTADVGRVDLAGGAHVVGHVLARTTGLALEDLAVGGEAGEAELLAAARELASRLADPAVALGIQTCNWLVLDNLREWADRVAAASRLNSADRRDARTVALYLQRLCGKCDTNGAYGPVYWGRLDPRGDRDVDVRPPAANGIGRHVVNVAHWAADALLRSLVLPALPADQRLVRRLPMVLVRRDHAVRIDLLQGEPSVAGPMPLTGLPGEVLRRTGGPCTVAALAASCGVELDRIEEAAAELAAGGWVRIGPEIPVGLADPIEWVRDLAAARLPAPARTAALLAVDAVRRLATRYGETSEPEQRRSLFAEVTALVSDATGGPARRGAGQVYADRYVLSEDAARAWDGLTLGAPVLRVIERDLVPVLRALMAVPHARWTARRCAMAAWFDRRWSAGQAPFLELCLAATEEQAEIAALFDGAEERTQQVARELMRLLMGAEPDGALEAQLDRGALEAFTAAHESGPCAVQPDLMLVRAAEGCRLVLGDLHARHDLLVHGSYVRVHPEPERLVEAVWSGYRSVFGAIPCVPLLEHTDQTITSLPLPTADVEVVGSSRKDPSMRLQPRDLTVARVSDGLELRAPGLGPVILTRAPVWHPQARTSPLSVFAPPYAHRLEDDVLPLDDRTLPSRRVLLGDVVVLRRSWRVTSDTLGNLSSFAPRHLFARVPGEPKPVLVDLGNPFLVDWLRRKLTGGSGHAELTEMYPDADDLWLAGARGHHCVEFRTSFFLGGRT